MFLVLFQYMLKSQCIDENVMGQENSCRNMKLEHFFYVVFLKGTGNLFLSHLHTNKLVRVSAFHIHPMPKIHKDFHPSQINAQALKIFYVQGH